MVGSDRLSGNATRDSAAKEILIGNTNYEETHTATQNNDPDEYGVYFVGEKIVIFGWSEADLTRAADAFVSKLAFSSYTNAEGKVMICVPKYDLEEKNNDNFFIDVPYTALDKRYDGALELYWGGATEAMYDAYCAEMTSRGFEVWQTNNGNAVKAITYKNGTSLAHVYFLSNCQEMRVVTQKNAVFPINEYEYTKVCDVSVTQFMHDYETEGTAGGMGYIILLEDGTFAVIDGGTTALDTVNFYNTLLDLRPAGVEEIVVSAWFLTHAHNDHYSVLKNFAKDYNDKLTVKYIIGNDLSDYYHTYTENGQTGRGFKCNVAINTDPDVIRREIEETVKICIKYGCAYDYVLKDISTVSHKPQNIIVWAETVSDVLDKYYGEE